ncbi:MAG: hypothetical protein LDL33_01955 [Desulfomonile sp.]|nr:hypothetical protein [Desulfomonile sp.]
MKADLYQDRARSIVGLPLLRSVLMAAVFLAALAAAGPSFGLWLPWAKEEDKIAKRLDEIWAAVLSEDKKMLRMYVIGNGAQAFIDQEIAHAKMTKVKSYTSRVHKATIDRVLGQFAWVDVERTATQASGKTVTDRSLRVFKKIQHDWKLLVDIPKDRKQQDKTAGTAASTPEKDFFDLMDERLPRARSR